MHSEDSQQALEEGDNGGGLALALLVCDDRTLAAHPGGPQPVEGGELRRVQGGAAHKGWRLLQVTLGVGEEMVRRGGVGRRGVRACGEV